jgi:hypothetical protein
MAGGGGSRIGPRRVRGWLHVRYVVPVILFAAAAFVWHYNATHDDAWLLFPFLDLIPSLEGQKDEQADWSWKILAGLGALTLLIAIVGDVRRRTKSA